MKELLSRLLSVNIHRGMKLDLREIATLDKLLGCPSKSFPSVHIAGSNGKGSVSTKIAAGLEAAGFHTGLYTSPHLACFRERIQINRQMLSEADLERHLKMLFTLYDKHQLASSFFELTTALAFAYFAEKKVERAVVEVGLGGRLDATNILQPQLSIITSISLEHTDILGHTLEEIAREKCGIIKPNTPLLIGPRVPREIAYAYAKQLKSPVIEVSGSFSDYHEENQAIARRALQFLQVSPAAISQAIEALPPCRLEIFKKEALASLGRIKAPIPEAIIFDVAHNPDGFFHLLKALEKRFPGSKLRFLIGMSKNKESQRCFALLKEKLPPIHLVEALNPRAASAKFLKEELIDLGFPSAMVSCETSVSSGMLNALKQAALGQELLVVCGTFFIMAAARKTVGIEEPSDPIDLNEQSTTIRHCGNS